MPLLSDHVDALFACVTSVLDGEALGQKRSHQVQSTLEAVLSVVHRAIAAYSERWNTNAAILPAELLMNCFEFLAFDDCLRVSGVSRHWRRVALRTPGLWSSFAVPYELNEGKGKLEEMLRRSQALPLSVQVYGTSKTGDTRATLSPHFGRIRSMKCTYPLGTPADMPLLELLELGGHDKDSEFVLQAWPSHRLRVLRLNRFDIRPDCPAFANLREFRGIFTARTNLSRLLSLCPSLESLAIKCATSLGVNPRTLFVPLPPSLLDVSITGLFYVHDPKLDTMGTWAGHHFRRLNFSCLQDVSSACRLFESILDPSEPGWSLDLVVEKTIWYILETPTTKMRVEGPGYTPPLAIAAISNLRQCQPYLARLTSLRVPLRYLGLCVEAGLVLPSLTDLTFTVHPERDHKPAGPDAKNVAAMIVPRLQSFVFVFQRGTSDTIEIPTNAVKFFFLLLPKRLRTWMQYDAEMLDHIALIGTVEDQTLSAMDSKVSDLHALAKTVHIGPIGQSIL